jgi:hypothetical protein
VAVWSRISAFDLVHIFKHGAYIATYRGEILGADRATADRYAMLDA